MQHCLRERTMRAAIGTSAIPHMRMPSRFNFNLGVESSIDRDSGQSRILSLPTWAGISTLALAPGCCGFIGPVPSATLDKRCWLKQQMQDNKTGIAVKRGIEPRVKMSGKERHKRRTARDCDPVVASVVRRQSLLRERSVFGSPTGPCSIGQVVIP